MSDPTQQNPNPTNPTNQTPGTDMGQPMAPGNPMPQAPTGGSDPMAGETTPPSTPPPMPGEDMNKPA